MDNDQRIMNIDVELQCLLEGKLAHRSQNPIDFENKGEENYVPVVKHNVSYIVLAVLINNEDEVLMIQEAKTSCYGLWYIPAGRMEPNETITEAVKREVLEESGLDFEPTSLLCVEVCSGYYYRFTLTGHVTGGTLKTTAHQDKESLQARWCSLDTIKGKHKGFVLRARDILPLIDIAVKRHSEAGHTAALLPAVIPHTQLLLRTLIIHTNADRTEVQVVTSSEPFPHIPVSTISPNTVSLQTTINHVIQTILGDAQVHSHIEGIVAVEHDGRPARLNDGLCLTVLISLTTKDGSMPKLHKSRYKWNAVTGDKLDQMKSLLLPGKLTTLLIDR